MRKRLLFPLLCVYQAGACIVDVLVKEEDSFRYEKQYIQCDYSKEECCKIGCCPKSQGSNWQFWLGSLCAFAVTFTIFVLLFACGIQLTRHCRTDRTIRPKIEETVVLETVKKEPNTPPPTYEQVVCTV